MSNATADATAGFSGATEIVGPHTLLYACRYMRPLPSQDDIQSYYMYHPDGYLFRLEKWRDFSKDPEPAGSISNKGRRIVSLNGKGYQAHRLIWKWHYGSDPIGEIDHINGDPLDNRIQNLRDVPNYKNQAARRNQKPPSMPREIKLTNRGGTILASFRHGEDRVYLGEFVDKEEAIHAYHQTKALLRELSGDGNDKQAEEEER